MAGKLYNGIKITRHAEQRAQERFGLTFDKIAELAVESLEDGIDALGDPTLREMLIDRAEKWGASGIYTHCGIVFIFINDILVTVYPISWIALYNHPITAA